MFVCKIYYKDNWNNIPDCSTTKTEAVQQPAKLSVNKSQSNTQYILPPQYNSVCGNKKTHRHITKASVSKNLSKTIFCIMTMKFEAMQIFILLTMLGEIKSVFCVK